MPYNHLWQNFGLNLQFDKYRLYCYENKTTHLITKKKWTHRHYCATKQYVHHRPEWKCGHLYSQTVRTFGIQHRCLIFSNCCNIVCVININHNLFCFELNNFLVFSFAKIKHIFHSAKRNATFLIFLQNPLMWML